MTASHDAAHVGSILGDRYELVRHIARGGMGDVYEARDRLLQRPAAVKLFRASNDGPSRFENEIRILAKLNHPGLIQVYDVGVHGEDSYVVLELVDGAPLSCADGCPPDEVARIGAAVADTLAYVHGCGIVHRDVTPSNVLRDSSGRVRLVDFGIVRELDGPRVTSASITLGTPAYMAPEQVRGGDVTAAADVYSLGLVLLELLTGRREFEGPVQEMVIARLARDPDTTTGVPPGWRPVLRAMLQRDPVQRPGAADVARRLEAMGSEDPTTAPVEIPAMVPAFATTAATVQAARPPHGDRATRSRLGRPVAMFATAVAAAVMALILVSGLGDKQPLAPAADAGTSSTSPDPGGQAPEGRSTQRPQSRSTASDPTTPPGEVTTAPPAPAAGGPANQNPLNALVSNVPRRSTSTTATTATTSAPTTTEAPTTTTPPTPDTTAAPPDTTAEPAP